MSKIYLAERAELDELKSEIDYIHPLTITEFRVSPNLLEKGEPYTGNIIAYWSVSRQAVDVKVDGNSVNASPVTIPVTNMTQNRTFTMLASKNGVTKTANASVEFVPPVFWGVSKTYNATASQIGSLANKVITKSRGRTIAVNSGAGDYVLYALPKSMGTPTFAVGPLTGGFQKIGGDIQFDKYGTVYNLYRSDNANLGSISITVT